MGFYWYRGHATPSYSVIVPPLVSALGAFFVCAFASLIATVWFAVDQSAAAVGRDARRT